MANRSAILAVRIISDAKDFKKGTDQAAGSLDKFKAKLGGIAVPAAAITAAVIGIGKAAIDSASAAEQAQGASDAVFGKWAASADKLSKDTAQRLGLAESQYDQFAAIVGKSLQGAGFEGEALVSQTDKVVSAGADLSAMWGGTVPDAMSAITAGFRGEFDALEKYGIKVNETTIMDSLRAQGLGHLTGLELEKAKAYERQAQILAQVGPAQGAFNRESTTAAGSSAILTAQLENLSAKLGTQLLPLMVGFATTASDVVGFVTQNSEAVSTLAIGVGIAAGAILLLNGIMAVTNLIAAANPFVLIAVGVAALIAGVVIAYNKVGWFKDGVDAMARFAVDAFNNVSNAVQGVIRWVSDLFNGFSIPGWMRDVMSFMGLGAVGFDFGEGMTMKGLIGGPSLAGLGEGMGAVGGSGMSGLFGGSGGGSTTVNNYTINIDGALDTDGTARQIEQLLRRLSRNTGSIPAAGGF